MGLRAPRLPGQSLCMAAALPALPARPGPRAPGSDTVFQAQTPRTPLPPDLHLPSRLRHILRFPAPVRASPSGHGLRPRWARCPLRRVDSDLPGPPPRTVSSRGEDAALCSALPAGSRASCSFPTETLGWGTALQPPRPPPPWPSGFRGLPCSLHLSVPEALWAKHLPVPLSACLQCTRVGGDLHGTLCAAVLCSRAVQLGEAT